MDHDSKPQITNLSQESLDEMKQITHSPYFDHIKKLGHLIKGKVVASSSAGHSGYLLRFEDSTWLLCWFNGENLDWETGDYLLTANKLSLMDNPNFLKPDKGKTKPHPYSNEEIHIQAETKKAHGQKVTGVSIGSNCFSVCFPKNKELEAHILSKDGKSFLSVFWEQW